MSAAFRAKADQLRNRMREMPGMTVVERGESAHEVGRKLLREARVNTDRLPFGDDVDDAELQALWTKDVTVGDRTTVCPGCDRVIRQGGTAIRLEVCRECGEPDV